jgi:hypothetical protein
MFLKGKLMKLCSVYLGDTLLDVFGEEKKYIDQVNISGTDIDVTEMIHSLDWDKFYQTVQEA